MAKAAHWTTTDAEAKARGANRIRYPGSPSPKRWMLGVAGTQSRCAGANALSIPPGEYGRMLKLKGIDGGPHKRWSMWFNSTQREEPYLGSKRSGSVWKHTFPQGLLRRCCMAVVSSCREMLG